MAKLETMIGNQFGLIGTSGVVVSLVRPNVSAILLRG